MVKNPPANAGDTGLIPERFHILLSNMRKDFPIVYNVSPGMPSVLLDYASSYCRVCQV